MVFEGWNIFSKQNKEGVCPPCFCPLNVAKPSLLKEIWIRCVNRKQSYKMYTNSSFHHSFNIIINLKYSLIIFKTKQLLQLHLFSMNLQPMSASFTLSTKTIVGFYSRNVCDRKTNIVQNEKKCLSDPKLQVVDRIRVPEEKYIHIHLSNNTKALAVGCNLFFMCRLCPL